MIAGNNRCAGRQVCLELAVNGLPDQLRGHAVTAIVQPEAPIQKASVELDSSVPAIRTPGQGIIGNTDERPLSVERC